MIGPGVFEVAEEMYQAGADAIPSKTPASLGDVAAHTQKRYLLLAEAAMTATGAPAPKIPQAEGRVVLELLAEHLAWKMRNPGQFWDGVREVFDRYAALVGEANLSDEVRKAMEI